MEQQNRTVNHNTVLEHTNPNPNDMAPEAPKSMAIVVGVGAGAGSESVVRSELRGSEVQPMKRGRGRPRKYDANGVLVSPTSAPPGFAASIHEVFESPSVKRSRGRPRGSGKLQILTSLGGNVAETAGGSFTPHVIIVNIGEDVVNKILTFFQKGPRSVCILSASGAVSSVILRQPTVPGGLLKYEGRFEILSLAGSCAYSTGGSGGGSRKEGVLSISLAKPDGRVFGGALDSALIAASPIQLVMATFMQNITKQIKKRLSPESSGAAPPNQDSKGGRNKVPKLLLEGEQSYPAPPTTPPPPPAVVIVPKAIAIGTTTNGEGRVQDGVVTIAAVAAAATTNNAIADDNVIIPTAIPTKVVPHVVITEDLNLDSTSVDDDGVDMDQKTSSSAPVVDTNNVP